MLFRSDQPFAQTTRTMVTRKKRLARREKRRLAAKRAEKSGDGKVSSMSKKGNILDALSTWTKFLNNNCFAVLNDYNINFTYSSRKEKKSKLPLPSTKNGWTFKNPFP